MVALQREIVDERRCRFGDTPYRSGVGSLGVFGLSSGLTGSEVGRGVGEVGVGTGSANHRDFDVFRFHIEHRMAEAVTLSYATRSQTSGLRERELEWRRTHAATLRQYENEWVVLEAENIVAHGSDPAQVIQDARRNNIQNPYIFFVEQDTENVVRIGL